MNKTLKIASVVVVLFLLTSLFYSYKNANKKTSDPIVAAPITGCYVATLSKDIYTLIINQEKGVSVSGTLAYKNFDKDSSSGSFNGTFSNDILLGDYTFYSEGMYSVRQVIFKKVGDTFIEGFGPVATVNGQEKLENTATVKYDTKMSFIKSTHCNDLSVYTEQSGTYSFNYNSNFTVVGGEETKPTKDWRLDATTLGVLLSTLTVPKSYMPGTNFSDAKFTIGRSTNPADIKSCLSVPNDKTVTSAKIAGYPAKKIQTIGAAAGNLYETTTYRAILDGDCYALEYTIHSTNIANYSPDQNIKEYDKAKIQQELETIIATMRWQLASN